MVNQKTNNKRTRDNRYKKGARQVRVFPAGWPVALLKLFSAAAAIGVMSLLFVFGHDWITQCEYFRAATVEVSGIERLDRKHVLETAKIAEGVNLLSVNLNISRKRLLALGWVADAEIRRELPDTLIIKVREHTPVAVIELGKSFLVNGAGEIFVETEKEKFRDLPVISGVKYQDWKADSGDGKGMSESVMDVLRLGRAKDSVLPCAFIKRIQVDRELGLTVVTRDFPAERIHLGFGGYESKYHRMSRIFIYLNRRGAEPAFEKVDLRYKDRIVARPAGDQMNLTKL